MVRPCLKVEYPDARKGSPRPWLENLHPRDRTGQFTAGGGHSPGGGRDAPPGAPPAPLTDTQYTAHTQTVERVLGEALAGGLETHTAHTLNGDGITYTPERAKLHKELVDEIYTGAADVPNDGRAVIAGGLGGAGKSTVLRGHASVDPSDYMTINPDDIKELMAARGMVPSVEGLSPMEASPLIHEESSHIANLLASRAYRDRKNVMWDITMSRRGSVDKRINQMRANGYGTIDGVFVDIPVDTSVQRALSRHRRGHEKYRQGKGPGGRYVPPAIIRSHSSATSSSANRDVFEDLRDTFDHWELFDNSGSAPQLVDSSTEPRPTTPARRARGHTT